VPPSSRCAIRPAGDSVDRRRLSRKRNTPELGSGDRSRGHGVRGGCLWRRGVFSQVHAGAAIGSRPTARGDP
jgi:hypothetical protein